MIGELIDNALDRVRGDRRLATQEREQLALEERLRILESEVLAITNEAARRSVADNWLRNGECEFSDDVYNNTPAVGGDEDHLCAWWFAHDAADTLLGTADADLVKDSGHSAYAADDPDWDSASGRLRLGTDRPLMQPLPNVFAQPGADIYVQFTATLRTATALPSPLVLFVELYDNTAGEERVIEGAPLEVTAVLGDGSAAGTTATEYLAIITTDDGEEYEAVMGAPLATAPDALSATDFVRVSWPAVPARVRVDLYRHRSGVYALLTGTRGITSGSTDYNDYGDAGTVVGGFPSAANTALRARVRDTSFAPAFGEVRRYGYTIHVPDDYDNSVTDEQCFRLGLEQATTDARQVVIDRVSVGQNYGGFQRGPLDLFVEGRVSVFASPTGGLRPAPVAGSEEPPDPGRGGILPERTQV